MATTATTTTTSGVAMASVDELPRDALRGLPHGAIRLISNLCREVFHLNQRIESVEQGALDARAYPPAAVWASNDHLLACRSALEQRLVDLHKLVRAQGDDHERLAGDLANATRDANRRAGALDAAIKGVGDGVERRERSAMGAVRDHLATITKRQDSCWETVHCQQQTIVELESQIIELTDRHAALAQDVRQRSGGAQARLDQAIGECSEAHKALTIKVNRVAHDAETQRARLQHDLKEHVATSFAYEKNNRQDEIRLLLESTQQIQERLDSGGGGARQHDRKGRSSAGEPPSSDDLIRDVMTTVNANATLFTGKFAQLLDQFETLQKQTRLTDLQVHQLAQRVQSSFSQVTETMADAIDRRLRAKASPDRPPIQVRGDALSSAGAYSLQTQLDRIQEQRANDSQTLRKSIESIVDALATFSSNVDSKIRRLENRHRMATLAQQVRRTSIEVADSGGGEQAATNVLTTKPALQHRRRPSLALTCRIPGPARRRHSTTGSVSGRSPRSSRVRRSSPPPASSSLAIAVGRAPGATVRRAPGRASRRQAASFDERMSVDGPSDTSMPLLKATERRMLEQFEMEHSAVPKYVFTSVRSEAATRLGNEVRRQASVSSAAAAVDRSGGDATSGKGGLLKSETPRPSGAASWEDPAMNLAPWS